LRFARGAWAPWIGDLLERMELAFDLRREEEHWLASRDALHGEPTGPLGAAPDYTGLAHEDERFSDDAEWMPRTVMIAKSTLVWLDQLARRHGRAITRLDQVPDEELARLAAFGINALWLIGVWERSAASRLIKRLAGNPDAAASAYALHDYSIAEELGGEDAWRGLRDRAAAHGIRLASDMVPNHVGIDSPWVTEHPEWFLQREDCPYPSYRFEGHELSSDPRVSIRIEDHYWDRSDAAVVFRHIDHRSGRRRFLYHGNDGTSFPWNDTAQIDYLNPAAREAVMQAILSVARRFPIIRFDAAMTLAKRHIQRLWFPPPGEGGAIPSRAGLGPTREEFDRLMPREFWREVVDRVAVEAPGTLLLAEAFWLMEGYFVRTLGMHRVYNSAFMVMLRDERNADFRRVLRDTLEFDPGILQRWVNFLNNPDERTAVDQFGRGEKYFGACTMRRHAARTADVRARPGRGPRGALRHGVPPRAARRARRRGARARALATHRAAAAPPLDVRGRRELPPLRLHRPRGLRQRGRVRVLQPRRPRRRDRAPPQSLGAHRRARARLGGVRRETRRRHAPAGARHAALGARLRAPAARRAAALP
jgi:hypothetical protein